MPAGNKVGIILAALDRPVHHFRAQDSTVLVITAVVCAMVLLPPTAHLHASFPTAVYWVGAAVGVMLPVLLVRRLYLQRNYIRYLALDGQYRLHWSTMLRSGDLSVSDIVRIVLEKERWGPLDSKGGKVRNSLTIYGSSTVIGLDFLSDSQYERALELVQLMKRERPHIVVEEKIMPFECAWEPFDGTYAP